MEKIKNTPLFAIHKASGGKIVEFAGFRMPIQYTGIVDEHHAVRKAAGLFDVSHMGEVLFRGPNALESVNRLVTNNVAGLKDNQVLYTPICYPDGGIVDDCLVYRHSSDHFMMVINASNIQKDFAWIIENTGNRCNVTNISDETALIALQGPLAPLILSAVSSDKANKIPTFFFASLDVARASCICSRTGYTGEDGFEIYCSPKDASKIWEALMEVGEKQGLKPCGLGARDTLRLEARLPLYGNDIDATTSPLEAGLGWTVKLNAGDFIGRDALLEQKHSGVKRKLVCLVMQSRGIARHGYPICILQDNNSLGEIVGQITSGTKSPTLDQAIALGYVPTHLAEVGTKLAVNVRDKSVEAEVVKGPFYKRKFEGV